MVWTKYRNWSEVQRSIKRDRVGFIGKNIAVAQYVLVIIINFFRVFPRILQTLCFKQTSGYCSVDLGHHSNKKNAQNESRGTS